MRVLIAGSRDIADPALIIQAVQNSGFTVDVLICGMARGVDRLAYDWAIANGIPVEEYPADWDRLGKSAGMVRNRKMVEVADAAIVIWDGNSPGTEHTIQLVLSKGIPFHLHEAF